MRIVNFAGFQSIVDSSKGQIWMQDGKDIEYDLKSESGMRRVITLLVDPDNELELYASDPNVAFGLAAFLMKQNRVA